MTCRIEVGFKEAIMDAMGEKLCKRAMQHLGISINYARIVDVYTIDADLSPDEAIALAMGPFSDPVIQDWSINSPLGKGFDWLIETGFKPGVTDNTGRTASEVATLCLGKQMNGKIYSSKQYLLRGELERKQVERVASELLANELIHRIVIINKTEFDPENAMPSVVPVVRGENSIHVEQIDLNIADEGLLSLSRERLLALNLEEMLKIKGWLLQPSTISKRAEKGLSALITDVEMEAVAQTWSEHCKHKIFNAYIRYQDESGNITVIDSLFNTFIKGATEEIRKALGDKDWCLSVFKDNAGVIEWDDKHSLVFKVETHNSPSALDPYGGALTGIVGVNRDALGTGKGAKLIFNTDVFCFASPFYKGKLPPRIMHPSRIVEGVREGVEHGGNKSGIPTVNGSIVFDDRFLGKPLVYCGTAGIMPKSILGMQSHEKEVIPGDAIVMTGGRIGKDGIHGATFSSEELHEGSPVTAVQIGDPITQKRMADFILEARDRGLFRAITDNGAGGLSSSVGEMACMSNGCEMDLSKAPLKYPGLQPWEILVSEAQERMTFAVPVEHVDEFVRLAGDMYVEATVLGRFTDTGFFHVTYDDQTVAYLDMDFLHNGTPQMRLEAKWRPSNHEEKAFREPVDMPRALKAMLSRLNICSKESVVRQYDHEVQGGSVVKPLCGVMQDGPSDASVIRPVLESMAGVVVSHGICPRYSDIDTYNMMACVIDEALRNFICVGGSFQGIAGLDNFCWCDPVESDKNPDGKYKLAQLVRANMALFDYTTAYRIPCISGKDSMKNDYIIGDHKISIPPTVLFSIIGKVDDVRKCITMDVKEAGDRVYILGVTKSELGGSEYYAMNGLTGNTVPKVNAAESVIMYKRLHDSINKRLVKSCHDCSDGGLGVALAESAFAGGLGLEIDLRRVPVDNMIRDDLILFSETQSRFVITVAHDKTANFEAIMKEVVFADIGVVVDNTDFIVRGKKGDIIINENIFELKKAWQETLAT